MFLKIYNYADLFKVIKLNIGFSKNSGCIEVQMEPEQWLIPRF